MKEKEAANYLKAILERDYNDGFHCEEEAALKKAIKLLELNILNTPIIDLALAQFELGYQSGIKEGRKDGYAEGQKDAIVVERIIVDSDKYIEQGRNEAWDAAKKIYLAEDNGGLPYDDVRKIFGRYTIVLKDFSASEAIEKLREYEEKKREEDEIKVGDEVALRANSHFEGNIIPKAIVIAINSNSSFPYHIMIGSYGYTEWIKKDDIVRKTGRHFFGVETLNRLKESE